MKRRLLLAAALAATTALALTACGTSQPAATSGAAAGTKAITLTDATSTKVKLDGPATRVVGLEWNVVEDLVALGVNPVGVADVKGYNNWDSAVALKNTPKDVGTRGEPSLDTIAALSPDLIVATTDATAASITQLRAIAPVLVVRPADASHQVAQMFTVLDQIAKATGTTAKATALTTAFDKTISDAKAKFAAAGLDGTKFAFTDAYVDSNQVYIRPYAKGSLIADVTAELGLVNAWTVKGDKAYGLATADVESLTKLGDPEFIYITNAKDGGDTFGTTLKNNAIWKSLSFVKDGNVHRLPDGIWLFGGPAAMTAYVTALEAALVK